MTSRSAELLQEALSLPPDERAEIAERLLSSLDTPTDRGIEAMWAEEAEDRLDALERGDIKTVAARQALDQVGTKPK